MRNGVEGLLLQKDVQLVSDPLNEAVDSGWLDERNRYSQTFGHR